MVDPPFWGRSEQFYIGVSKNWINLWSGLVAASAQCMVAGIDGDGSVGIVGATRCAGNLNRMVISKGMGREEKGEAVALDIAWRLGFYIVFKFGGPLLVDKPARIDGDGWPGGGHFACPLCAAVVV